MLNQRRGLIAIKRGNLSIVGVHRPHPVEARRHQRVPALVLLVTIKFLERESQFFSFIESWTQQIAAGVFRLLTFDGRGILTFSRDGVHQRVVLEALDLQLIPLGVSNGRRVSNGRHPLLLNGEITIAALRWELRRLLLFKHRCPLDC